LYACKAESSKGGSTKNKNKDDDDDAKTTASSIKQLTKGMKSMQKKMDNMYAQLADSDKDSNDDSGDEEGSCSFQVSSLIANNMHVVFTQVATAKFEEPIQKLFNQKNNRPKDLDLCEVVLLDSQSTVDLFGNKKLVELVFKSKGKLRLTSNGGQMHTDMKCKLRGYHSDPWFHKRAITNIIALANMNDSIELPTTVKQIEELSLCITRSLESRICFFAAIQVACIIGTQEMKQVTASLNQQKELRW